ncbi:MAG: carboxypeptidase-like regulatory domain-containing protein [Gilvibacter sp.]
MNKTFTLSIPEPCHEDWNKMTPQDKGRFCDSCEKVVVDFTGKSDVTIANHLRDHKNVCGRFNVSQLNRPILLDNRRKSLIPPLAASFILPLALLLSTKAYTQVEPISTQLKSQNFVSLNIGSQTNSTTKGVKGQVTTKDGLPLAGVRVSELGTNNHTQTDFEGNYRLEIALDGVLSFSYVGFFNEQVSVNSINDIYSVSLRDCINCLDEVVVVTKCFKEVSVISGNIQSTTTIKTTASDYKKQRKIIGDSIQIKQDSLKTKIISGFVKNQDGLPLDSVQISVNGIKVFITNNDGAFEIQLNTDDVLHFTAANYYSKTYTVLDSTATIQVTLRTIQEHRVMGGAIASVTVVKKTSNWNLLFPNQLPVDPSRKIPKEELQQRYKNATAFKKIQQEKKKQAKREARAARKKRK